MTFSLLGRCERTGRLGVVVCSSSPAVAARCAFVRAGVGAAASQNITDPSLGARLLDAMQAGASGPEAVHEVATSTPNIQYRQLSALDAHGRGAAFSGQRTLGTHGERIAADCVAAGNLLAGPHVLDALVESFAAGAGEPLGTRLVRALAAGAQAGGEVGPVHSAGMLVADAVPWPVADLRVDWSDDPTRGLEALWEIYAPQLDDYVVRALDPERAPIYGVPGETSG